VPDTSGHSKETTKKMALTIRKAKTDDAIILAENNLLMAKETEGVELDKEVTLEGVHAVISDENKGFYLLADREGEIVGQLMVTFEWSDWRNGQIWWVQSVYVPATARREAVFTSLYETLLLRARRAKNIVGLRLYVAKGNRGAQLAYQKIGMQKGRYDMFEIFFDEH
jgi:GNAT superfamily N-acetyltransferase